MRKFSYFYYDNFSADEIKHPTDDPRAVLNGDADALLTEIIETIPGGCQYHALCACHTKARVDQMIHIGLLRRAGNAVLLDTPVFVHEDVDWLRTCFAEPISNMANALIGRKDAFYRLAEEIRNGFPPEINLYHLLCGAVFDGEFFDFLSSQGAVATSRMHPSGLDYLTIVYEQSPVLDALSNKLLCSYNRFSDGARSLQSFGDADGERVDFFRFSRQKQLGRVPEYLMWIESIWGDRENVLTQVQKLIETGSCEEKVYQLLEAFGYARDGKIVVPIYRGEHLPTISRLEQLAEAAVGGEMKRALCAPGVTSGLLCSRHGVAAGEIANELYHVLFGQLNEWLTETGFAAKPPYLPGQGRYLKSIEIF